MNDPNVTSTSLSNEMLYNLNIEEGLSEGGLIDLADTQRKLLNKSKTENCDDDETTKNFTTTFLNCNDILLGPKPAWENIKTSNVSYEVTLALIETSSQSGELYVANNNNNKTKDDLVYNGTMMYTEIRVDINSSSDYCFPNCSLFSTENEHDEPLSRAMIRIPAAVLQSYSDKQNQTQSVGTVLDLKYGTLPNVVEGKESEFENEDSEVLFSTTLDFSLAEMDVHNLPKENEIKIAFKLEKDQVSINELSFKCRYNQSNWDE